MEQPSQTGARSWLDHLSLRRIITSNRFIPEVDGFRFLAIAIVIIAHIAVQAGPPLSNHLAARMFRNAFDGRHGVCLFFTISGFILALPFARHHLLGSRKVAVGSYFKRRLTRLEPPYILIMVVRGVLLILQYQALRWILATQLLASLFYVHSLVFDYSSKINPPAWSLEIEIQFYLLAPLLTSVFAIRSTRLRRTIIVAVMLAFSVATLYMDSRSRAGMSLLYFFQYFAAGFLLCDLYLSKARLSLKAYTWDCIGFLGLGYILFGYGTLYPILLPFATLCLYMAGFYGRIIHGFFSIPAISIIGGMCYSIYLTHTTVLSLFNDLLHHTSIRATSFAIQTAVIYPTGFITILAFGTIYFILIERPCMDPNWPRNLSNWLLRRSPTDVDKEQPATLHS